MKNYGNSPPALLEQQFDYALMSARALPLTYELGERDEDTAREWLGQFATHAVLTVPDLAHFRPYVERAISLGRGGDAKADAAVVEGSAEIEETVAETRSLVEQMRDWLTRKWEQAQRAAGVRHHSRAAA